MYKNSSMHCASVATIKQREFMKRKPGTPSELLTERDLAVAIGLTARGVQARRLRGDDLPPAIRISARCLRWDRADVQNWLQGLKDKRPSPAAA